MAGSVRLITPPSAEPVSLEEARRQVSLLDGDDTHDARLTQAIRSARAHAEAYLHRAFFTQTRELALDGFPPCIELPFPPVQSVSSVKYTDFAGAEQTVATGDLDVDLYSSPARIRPAYGVTWPVPRPGYNTVRVRYVAGYTKVSEVPEDLRHGLLLLIGHYFDNREAVFAGGTVAELPLGVAPHFNPHVVHL